jgi:hypothetical protein
MSLQLFPPHLTLSTSLWPHQDSDFLAQMNKLVADVNVLGLPACFQCDIISSENLVLEVHISENQAYLESMTWTFENRGSSPAERVAIISLKVMSK